MRVEPCVSSALGFRTTSVLRTRSSHQAAITGCVSQGESLDELLENVREAVEGCLSVDALNIPVSDTDRVMEIAV